MEGEGNICCFYPNSLPRIDEVVMVRISKITDAGVYCDLLEYGNTPGLIVVGELSKKKFVNVHSLVKIHKVEACIVLRVDEDKKYVDLSRKKVTPEEFAKCVKQYSLAKISHNILCYCAKKLDVDVINLYKTFAYPKIIEHGSLYVYFTKLFSHSVEHDNSVVIKCVMDALKRKFGDVKYKIRAEFECYTTHKDGVLEIIRVLKLAKLDSAVKIVLVAPPVYAITASSTDKESGLRDVHLGLEIVKENMLKGNGHYLLTSAPIVTGDRGNIEALCAKYDDLYDEELKKEFSDSSSSTIDSEQ